MKKVIVSVLAALAAMLVPTAASAEGKFYGQFYVDQYDEVTCAMAINVPNGMFFISMDTSAKAVVAASRPGFAVTPNSMVTNATISFNGNPVKMVGLGISDGSSGGVAIPISDGASLLTLLGVSETISVEIGGQAISGVYITDDFVRATNAMLACTGNLAALKT